MRQVTQTVLLSIAVTALSISNVHAEDAKPVTEQLVDTMTQLAGGPHAGYRANHAKGIVTDGEFTPQHPPPLLPRRYICNPGLSR